MLTCSVCDDNEGCLVGVGSVRMKTLEYILCLLNENGRVIIASLIVDKDSRILGDVVRKLVVGSVGCVQGMEWGYGIVSVANRVLFTLDIYTGCRSQNITRQGHVYVHRCAK